jgi:hypothetical protein
MNMSKEQVMRFDGFETYEDHIEGADEQRPSSRVIRGTLLKFTNEATWITREGQEISADVELVAVDVIRIVQRWKDRAPVETVILKPGEKFPDLEKLNGAVPQEEWVRGPDGKLRGPFQAQHIVYFRTRTMDEYSFPTGTTGGRICVRDLVERVQWMRRFRGANVYPVVTLSDTFFRTRFGGRQRPHFLIKRWTLLDGEAPPSAPVLSRLAPPTAAAIEANVPKPEPPQDELSGARTVEPPSLGEELNDSIPF